MLTKEKILDLNKKELEVLFNTTITNLSNTSIEPSEIKQIMFEELKKQIVEGIDIRHLDYHYNNIRLTFDMITIDIKISTKGTGKIRKITKLKSKEVKTIGAFKISNITHDINGFCYEIDDKSKWTVKIEKNVWCSSDVPYVYLSGYKNKLSEMLDVDFLLKAIDKQETDLYEERILYNYTNNSKWRGLRHEIGLKMSQPILKPLFLNKISIFNDKIVENKKLKEMPEPFYSKLDDITPIEDLFELIINVVSEINKDLINDVIYNKLFKR